MNNSPEQLHQEVELLKYELETTIQFYNAIIDVLGELISFKDLKHLFNTVLSKITDYFEIERSIFAISRGDTYEVLSSIGFDKATAFKSSVRSDRSLLWCVSEIGSSMIVPDLLSDVRFDENELFQLKEPTGVITTCLNSDYNYGIFLFYFKNIPLSKLRSTLARLEMLTSIFSPHFFNRLKILEMDKEKERMQEQVFHASKLATIGTLAAGVAHEINNPLAIISGYLDCIKDYFHRNLLDEEEIRKAIDWQEKSIKRISDIVNGLRIYARQDTDHIEDVDVPLMLERALSLVEEMYKKENILFQKKLNAKEKTVRGNSGKFQQVIMNLLSNSRDALLPKNGGTITIETSNENDRLIVSVSDDGCGIQKDIIDRVFDTFFTTKEAGRGTGLGLGISYEIISKMQGDIKVESQPEIGTTFFIDLPFSSGGIISEYEAPREIPQKFSGRVLVVDDEEAIRNIMNRYLTTMGFSVETAVDGDIALDMIIKNNYDFVFTDLKMPHMSGCNLIEEINRLGLEDIKIIVITGGGIVTAYQKKQHSIIRKLAHGYIKKPIKIEDIYRVIRNLVK